VVTGGTRAQRRLIVEWLTLWDRPMLTRDSPVSLRHRLPALVVRQFRLAAQNHAFGFGALPALVRLRINSRSNSAKPPR
jgi:hypothetical protein